MDWSEGMSRATPALLNLGIFVVTLVLPVVARHVIGWINTKRKRE